MRTIPAGITWERHGRLRSTVTIRREPEVVFELADYAAGMNNTLNSIGLANALTYGRCPYCGSTVHYGLSCFGTLPSIGGSGLGWLGLF
jgi:hypothetical protein